jgi:hypothetical protein
VPRTYHERRRERQALMAGRDRINLIRHPESQRRFFFSRVDFRAAFLFGAGR